MQPLNTTRASTKWLTNSEGYLRSNGWKIRNSAVSDTLEIGWAYCHTYMRRNKLSYNIRRRWGWSIHHHQGRGCYLPAILIDEDGHVAVQEEATPFQIVLQ